MTRKYREIKIRSDVALPAINTETPGRPYTYLAFLGEWVVGAREMRKDENLEALFEWEEALESFTEHMANKAGVTEPGLPDKVSPPELGTDEKANAEVALAYRKTVMAQAISHNGELDTYQKAVAAASVGEILYVTDDAFTKGKSAAKAALDAASTPDQQGRTGLAKPYEPKILRFYHALSQSKAIEEKDIPRGHELNGHASEKEVAAATLSS
jgi:hypothetical protein